MRDTINELCAGGSGLGRFFLGGSFWRSLAGFGLHFFDDFNVAAAGAATAVAAAATAVAASTSAVTASVASVTATMAMLVAATGIATRVAAGITSAVAAALATAVAAAFAGGRRFAALGLLLTTLGLATRVAGRAVMMAGKTAKAPAATTMACFRLGLQTHENNGKRRQPQGHAHQVSLHRNTSKNF
jgi:hypothetical protein